MVQPRTGLVGAARPLAGGGIPDLGAVVDADQLVPDVAAAGREHLAVRHDGRVDEAPARGERLRRRDRRRRAVDVDHHRAARVAAELQDPARPEHGGARVSARRSAELSGRCERARAARVHVVHAAGAVVAEDAAVRRDEVAREHPVECVRVRAGEQAKRAVCVADLGTVLAPGAALDVGLAVQQRRRRGVPARPVHVVLARHRVAAEAEQVAVVVAGVRRPAAGPVVAAGDEDLVPGRQHDLRAAEDVGARGVGQRRVAGVEAGCRVPDVVDENGGLLAGRGRAVSQHAAIRHQHRVHRDQRPGLDRRPGTGNVVGACRQRGQQECGSRRDAAQCRRDTPMGVRAHVVIPSIVLRRRWLAPFRGRATGRRQSISATVRAVELS